jgi:hypothetical protein
MRTSPTLASLTLYPKLFNPFAQRAPRHERAWAFFLSETLRGISKHRSSGAQKLHALLHSERCLKSAVDRQEVSMDKKRIWFGAVAALFLIVAIAGSIAVSRHMDRGVDQGAIASTGRRGDPEPNTAQQQEHAKSSRGPSTNGSITGGAVPPAGR